MGDVLSSHPLFFQLLHGHRSLPGRKVDHFPIDLHGRLRGLYELSGYARLADDGSGLGDQCDPAGRRFHGPVEPDL